MAVKSTILVFIVVPLLAIGSSSAKSPSDIWLECVTTCKGPEPKNDFDFMYGHMRNGTLICVPHPAYEYGAVTPCVQKCMGVEIPDQAKCWCEYCRMKGTEDLCEQPYANPVTGEDCENLICSGNMGKIKYYGLWCTGDDKHSIDYAKRMEE